MMCGWAEVKRRLRDRNNKISFVKIEGSAWPAFWFRKSQACLVGSCSVVICREGCDRLEGCSGVFA